MSRIQLALNVSDLERAVAFYSKLFGTGPAKTRPGYANFAVADPPLKLVLFENEAGRAWGVGGALNHVGIEVETPLSVAEASTRLAGQGLSTTEELETTCCFAVQDKVWVEDPDGTPWEIYTVLSDVPETERQDASSSACCPSTDANDSAAIGCC